MKKIIVEYDEFVNWNEILNWHYSLNIASNLSGYHLGEKLPTYCENSYQAFKALLKEKELSIKDVVFVPFYVYIHGGISFSINCSGQYCDIWDAGMAGYIWVEKKKFAKEFGYKKFTKKLKERFYESCKDLINGLNSEYYILTLKDENREIIDSISGIEMEFANTDEVIRLAKEYFCLEEGEIVEIIYKHYSDKEVLKIA